MIRDAWKRIADLSLIEPEQEACCLVDWKTTIDSFDQIGAAYLCLPANRILLACHLEMTALPSAPASTPRPRVSSFHTHRKTGARMDRLKKSGAAGTRSPYRSRINLKDRASPRMNCFAPNDKLRPSVLCNRMMVWKIMPRENAARLRSRDQSRVKRQRIESIATPAEFGESPPTTVTSISWAHRRTFRPSPRISTFVISLPCTYSDRPDVQYFFIGKRSPRHAIGPASVFYFLLFRPVACQMSIFRKSVFSPRVH